MSVFWRPRGCVLWFDFAELQGDTVYDLSGNNNHGTIYNCEWRRGHLVGSLYFNGTDAYVEVPYDSSFDVDNISIEVLVNIINTSKQQAIVSRGLSGLAPNRLWWLWIDSIDDLLKFEFSTDGSNIIGLHASPIPTGLQHIVAVVGTNRAKLIINNETVAEAIGTFTLYKYNRNLWIGSHVGGDFLFNGIIHHVRIYNRALSEREIRAHYHYLSQKYILHPALI